MNKFLVISHHENEKTWRIAYNWTAHIEEIEKLKEKKSSIEDILVCVCVCPAFKDHSQSMVNHVVTMVDHGQQPLSTMICQTEPWTLNGTYLTTVDHGQNRLQIDTKNTSLTMYNHDWRTCLTMVYHGKLLKSETIKNHSQPCFRFKEKYVITWYVMVNYQHPPCACA